MKEPCSPHGWTLDTLEVHLSAKINALKDQLQFALSSADKALTKAEIASEKRFDSVNEFRQTLQDQATTYVPRNELRAMFDALRVKEHEGFSRNQMVILAATSILSTLIAAGALVITLMHH